MGVGIACNIGHAAPYEAAWILRWRHAGLSLECRLGKDFTDPSARGSLVFVHVIPNDFLGVLVIRRGE
jgi:hypothetical protein